LVVSSESGAAVHDFVTKKETPNITPLHPAKNLYVVHGRYERHKRKFTCVATSHTEAMYEAEVMVNVYKAISSGVYGPMVWQYGQITLVNLTSKQSWLLRDFVPG
jgi:hypothetical protein